MGFLANLATDPVVVNCIANLIGTLVIDSHVNEGIYLKVVCSLFVCLFVWGGDDCQEEAAS